MKEYLRALITAAPDLLHGRHIAREYMQARILGSLQRAGAMIPLAFHGGIALRFLYTIPRYSEDLDFALENPEGNYDLRRYLQAVRSDLTAENYEIELRVSDQKTVQSGLIHFRGLFYELGLPAQAVVFIYARLAFAEFCHVEQRSGSIRLDWGHCNS